MAYFLVGWGSHLLGVRAPYPVFSWALFSTVPNEGRTEYSMRILEYQGKLFYEPTFYTKIQGLLSTVQNTSYYQQLIRKLVLDLKDKDTVEIKRSRDLLEKSFVAIPVTYEIVKIRYSTSKQAEVIEVVARFNTANK